MKQQLVLVLVALLLISGGLQTVASPKRANASPKQALRQERVEIKYKVEANKLMSVQGNISACKADNDFVVAALQSKKAELFGVDYTVDVTRVVTGFIQKDNRDELIIYEYRMGLKEATVSKTLNDFLRELHGKRSLTGGLVLYGTPVTCHYLLNRGQLVLLSYYGFPYLYEKFNPEKWIANRYFR